MKKILMIFLSIMLFTILAGCDAIFGNDDDVIIIDDSKTQLYIGNFDGGLGHAWLRAVADKFEEENEQVQIIINNEKDLFSDANLLINMPNYNNDIYFINAMTYNNYVAQNRLADITDVVSEVLEGEDQSILDKMNPTLKEYYKTNDNKYFAVPFFDSIFGTIYDVDLFEEEGFYFNTDGELIALGSSNTELSAGPNGVKGDFDDGLPATFSEWKILVDTIDRFGYIPYAWNGTYEYYRHRFLASIWASYEGKENFDINYSFDGEYTFPGDSNPTQINIENGYLLQQQPGKKYALDYAEYIIKEGLYYRSGFDSINTHTMAQQDYLLSATFGDRIAMLLEGTWWENEARPFFDRMETQYGAEYGYGQRKFGFMPTPKSDDGLSAPGTTLISSTGNSVVTINRLTPNLDIAKEFLKFAHKEESLRTFTRMTGNVRPYNYSITEQDRQEMTYYSNMMYDMYTSEDTQISYITLFYHKAFVEKSSFLGSNWLWKSTIDGHQYTEPFYTISQNASLTSEKLFKGLSTTFSKEVWDAQMSVYYNAG